MPIFNDPSFMQAIIMDHYKYPHNKRTVEDESYQKIHMDSDSCVDDIYVYLKVSNGVINDVAFDGIACTIATSSTSIMTDLVMGKTVEEARNIIKHYLAMINNEDYDEELLEEANVFQNTYKQANRIKCATIGWQGLKELLEKE